MKGSESTPMTNANRQLVLFAVVALAAGVFVLDVLTPLGVVEWMLYLPVILAWVWLGSPRPMVVVSAACSVLLAAGFFLSPAGIAPSSALLNRSLGLMALWLTAFAGITIGRRAAQLAEAVTAAQRETTQRKQAEHALQQLNETLEQRVAERTADLDRANAHLQEEIRERHRTQAVLRESKDRIDAIVNTAVEAIVTIDQHGIIESFNPAGERMFGYAASEVIGRKVNVLMPPPYREEHDNYLARYLATGQKKIIGIGREAVGLHKDGTTFPIDLSVAEARLGEQRLFVGMIRDISERKWAEEELEKSHATLEKALAELQAKNDEVKAMTQQLWQAAKLASVGELAAGIAHELNNPLATVSLRIESTLARTPPDDPRRRALEIIQQETKRMGDLVANLLQFARRGHEERSTVDVRQELTKAVELIHHHLRKRLVTVTQELAPDTPIIYADRQKLRQVFLNLLTNAGDAMPEGGTLTLRAAPTILDNGKPAVLIEFADTGVGIPAENLGRIMEPFFTTKEEGKGTGLGLAICRRIVQEHYGTIQIVSEVGKGTTVRVVLPVRNGANVEHLRGGALQE
jgi:PAS domain S-box-containing protein